MRPARLARVVVVVAGLGLAGCGSGVHHTSPRARSSGYDTARANATFSSGCRQAGVGPVSCTAVYACLRAHTPYRPSRSLGVGVLTARPLAAGFSAASRRCAADALLAPIAHLSWRSPRFEQVFLGNCTVSRRRCVADYRCEARAVPFRRELRLYRASLLDAFAPSGVPRAVLRCGRRELG